MENASSRKDSAVIHLFKPPPFVDFGPFALRCGFRNPPLGQVDGRRAGVLLAGLRERCPRQPGVYGMIDINGELVYVGKAKNLRARLLTYFRPRSRDSKAAGIIAQSRRIVWEPGPDEFSALHRELELIRRWRPRCNVQGKPRNWQYTYVCLGRPPAPHAFLAHRPPANCVASFGPVQAGRKASEAVRRLNDLFQLRDCPQAQTMIFSDQTGLFPIDLAAGCLRHAVGTCLGPCAGLCLQRDYSANVSAARAFLDGLNLAPLVRLEEAMKQAARQQQFERAAALRDKLAPLEWLSRQLERMRQAEAMSAVVYPVQGHDTAMRWYLLHRGRAVAAVRAGRGQTPGSASAETVAKLVRLAEGQSSAGLGAWIAGVMLLAAWFRRHPRERQALVALGVAVEGLQGNS
jgi:excinuclease ABC subunit C